MIYNIKNKIEKKILQKKVAKNLKDENGNILSFLEQAALLTHYLHLKNNTNNISSLYESKIDDILSLWIECLNDIDDDLGKIEVNVLKNVILSDMEAKPFYKNSTNGKFLFIDLFGYFKYYIYL